MRVIIGTLLTEKATLESSICMNGAGIRLPKNVKIFSDPTDSALFKVFITKEIYLK